jgi:hypothetical protein
MLPQKTSGLRGLILGMLALVLVLVCTEPSAAFHFGPRRFFFHRPHSHAFLGFRFYGYPYYPYYPYYYPYYYGYYAPYSPYPPYVAGEHRRFPAFRLPDFFQYPGALGKGEAESQAWQSGMPEAEGVTAQQVAPPGRAGK